jgi:hypothetical protein
MVSGSCLTSKLYDKMVSAVNSLRLVYALITLATFNFLVNMSL